MKNVKASLEALTKIFKKSRVEKLIEKLDLIGSIYSGLKNELLKNSYKPNNYTRFIVSHPALREIYAPDFRDRIIHHHLVDFLMPLVEKRLYAHAYANRIGKGTHAGVFASQKMMRQVGEKGYYMQCDISSYFPSINKPKLKSVVISILNRLPISDNDKNIIYSLFKVVIDQNPHLSYIQKGDASLDSKIRPDKKLGNKGEDIGLPIGSLTSQFSSLIYLNELDYFVKNELKYEKYIRYVDDMVFFNKNSRDFYEVSNNVNLYLEKVLKLELNPKKTKIQQFEKGLDFLGYVIYPLDSFAKFKIKPINKIFDSFVEQTA